MLVTSENWCHDFLERLKHANQRELPRTLATARARRQERPRPQLATCSYFFSYLPLLMLPTSQYISTCRGTKTVPELGSFHTSYLPEQVIARHDSCATRAMSIESDNPCTLSVQEDIVLSDSRFRPGWKSCIECKDEQPRHSLMDQPAATMQITLEIALVIFSMDTSLVRKNCAIFLI